jgi:hypothetical protein
MTWTAHKSEVARMHPTDANICGIVGGDVVKRFPFDRAVSVIRPKPLKLAAAE